MSTVISIADNLEMSMVETEVHQESKTIVKQAQVERKSNPSYDG